MNTPDLNQINQACLGTLAESMGLTLTKCEKNEVVGEMQVDDRTKQPLGYLHGGASVAMAETLASLGGWMHVAHRGAYVMGLEINANHLKSAREGKVTGIAKPIHIGGRTQVWEIKITDQSQNLLCVSRCTLAVLEPKS